MQIQHVINNATEIVLTTMYVTSAFDMLFDELFFRKSPSRQARPLRTDVSFPIYKTLMLGSHWIRCTTKGVHMYMCTKRKLQQLHVIKQCVMPCPHYTSPGRKSEDICSH